MSILHRINELLPPDIHVESLGSDWRNLSIQTIVMFGGRVAVHHATPISRTQSLARSQTNWLALNATGLRPKQIAKLTPGTSAHTHSQTLAYARSDIKTRNIRSATFRAFAMGVFNLIDPINPPLDVTDVERRQIDRIARGYTDAEIRQQANRLSPDCLKATQECYGLYSDQAIALYGFMSRITPTPTPAVYNPFLQQ